MPHNPVPFIPLPRPITRDAEIDQVKRDLDNLRARYASYDRVGRVWRIFFIVATPPIAIGVLAFAIKQILADMLSGVFLLGLLVICALLIVWPVYLFDIRWIDVASSRVIYPQRVAWWKSDARLLEDQIAECEQRLSKLEEIASE